MTVSAQLFKNDPAPGVDDYYPINVPPIGTPYSKDDYPQNKVIPKLFQPLTLRGVEFKNRIWVSSMCQYSAVDGHMTDWHLVHLGAFATRGPGAVMFESTAIVPEGRITPECPGIWSDTQIAPMKRIVDFLHSQGTIAGIQLAHAGRKASTLAPWVQDRCEKAVVGPSAIPFADTYPTPRALTVDGIKTLTQAYLDAVERCKKAGFDFIEIHGAHGYLPHEFCSPISNKRTDNYGGPLINRIRLPLEIIHAIRQAWDKPLSYRVSGTEYLGQEKNENGEWVSWGVEQVVEFARVLQKEGIDLLDVSSGGNWVGQKIPLVPGYQVPFAERVKTELPSLPVAAVGLITEPKQAEQLLQDEKADVLFFARELMRHADFPIYVAQELGIVIKPANQYGMAWTRMMKPKN